MGTIFRPKNCTYFVKRLKMAIFVEGLQKKKEQTNFVCSFMLAVEKVDGKSEISCEGDPDSVGDLGACRAAADAGVFCDRKQDERKQQQEPKEGKQKDAEAEKENGIEEVDKKAHAVKNEAVPRG